jgi:hypothetical protein
MRAWWCCVLAGALAACAAPPDADVREDSRLQYSAPEPEDSRPIPQGFTHRPPPDTPGLPAPPPPLLTAEEERAAASAAGRAGATERERAEREVLDRVSRYERSGSDVEGLREAVIERLRAGLLSHFTADALFARYLFPNEASADAALRGRLVAVTGTVAPHSMLDLADGFKVFDEAPYVQVPVLLATVYDLNFVRCLLARPELQKLRDWEEVHVVGVVSGKERTDVVLRRCVVLR